MQSILTLLQAYPWEYLIVPLLVFMLVAPVYLKNQDWTAVLYIVVLIAGSIATIIICVLNLTGITTFPRWVVTFFPLACAFFWWYINGSTKIYDAINKRNDVKRRHGN